MAQVKRLTLRYPGGETPILVGEGALEEASPEIARTLAGRIAFLVSTPAVLRLHGGALAAAAAAAANWLPLEVEEGEAAKSLATAERLWRRMSRAGGKRDSRLLAFGGGSVGDLGGFVAGCFLRGIPYLQVPTTLLAQVDAAIGGKTAVDLPEAKNSVGLFHHPELVVCEARFLATLPQEELRSGLFEVVKVAALADASLLELVEGDLERLLSGDPADLAPVVAAAAAAKVRVVEGDPGEEEGSRRLLNFGHTLGHALETAGGYGELRHGEAVGYGMLFALRLAERRGLARGGAERLRRLIRRLGLPPLPPLGRGEVSAAMARDKKAREGGLPWVLPAELGRGVVAEDVGAEELAAELEAFLNDPFAPPR